MNGYQRALIGLIAVLFMSTGGLASGQLLGTFEIDFDGGTDTFRDDDISNTENRR